MSTSHILPGDSSLALRLANNIEGEVLFDRASRGRYATDASIYQMEPLGVIVPRSIDDVSAALSIAREAGIPVLPRGGGTSQCGQTVNRALVIDCSKHLRNVLSVDAANRRAWVQPGMALGMLNRELAKEKLFFAVDPSTHARCTIGGMAGNNSCGSKSIRYGLMVDNVSAIDAILADGTQHRFGTVSDNIGGETPARIADLVQRLRVLGAAEADEIAARFPRQLRRVGGYNINALTPAEREAGRENLARLLVGSEGTLAFSAAIEVMLHPIKPRKVLGICQFATFRLAMEAAKHIVQLDPEAVELVDRTMIDLARQNPVFRKTVDRCLIGEPDSLLIVEFHGHEDGPLLKELDRLEELMGTLGSPGVVRAVDPAFQADIATVREAGLNIMMSMKGDGKPVSFIEDCAVDLEDLADYTERLNGVFEKYGSRGTWYAHASVGCLHVRPVLNMKDPSDVRKMRAIAEETFALVREYKGSHSGEHGDGLVRSEFHKPMFGDRIVRAFETVKDAFDPNAMLNPNRIVNPPKMDDRTLFRYGPDYAAVDDFAPKLAWPGYGGPLNGMLGAVEMCNNNGTCRAFDATVMCPSFRVTREEQHLTRGRANTLRLALTGQLGPNAMTSDAVAETMALCVSCKGCRRDCPTNVDMAKMKIEVQAARADAFGVKWREWLIAMLPRYARFVSIAPWLANLRNKSGLLRSLGERFLGFSAERSLPAWSSDPFNDWEANNAPPAENGDVLLLVDTFNRYFEPENIRAAIRVLRAAGYRAVVKEPQGRPLCCGRTYLAAGLVDQARTEAQRTLDHLAGELPVIGLEPSCLMTLRDEFQSLLPGDDSANLAKRAVLIGEFLADKSLPLKDTAVTAHVHGHCHQKSFGAFDDALKTLRQIPGLTAKPVQSSCCGMAGAFGYQAETQDVSRDMAEASLLPAVRAAAPQDAIVADGTSCRHQIHDLSGRTAVHSVVLLDRALR